MALANFAAYVTELNSPFQRHVAQRDWFGYSTPPHPFSIDWSGGDQGVTPDAITTSVACTKNTQGSLFVPYDGTSFAWLTSPFKNGAANQWLGRSTVYSFDQSGSATKELGSGTLMLIDRLNQQGGIVGNVTTPQTTNLPTVALTRYTNGEGVFAALERRSASFGSNISTWSASYTNSAGTAGRTSGFMPTFRFGEAANYFQIMNLQAGDIGVKSVESVTFSADCGGGGNAASGIVLFKPLLIIPCIEGVEFIYEPLEAMRFVEIMPDASLWWLYIPNELDTHNPVINSELSFFEA